MKARKVALSGELNCVTAWSCFSVVNMMGKYFGIAYESNALYVLDPLDNCLVINVLDIVRKREPEPGRNEFA